MQHIEQTVRQEDLNAYDTGRKELRHIIGMSDDAFSQLQGRAQFFIDGGHLERALIMLEMLEALDRTRMHVPLWTVDILLKLGRSDAAEEKLRELRERFGDTTDIQVSTAELLLQTGRPYDAASLLHAVIENDMDATTEAGLRARSIFARGRAMFGG